MIELEDGFCRLYSEVLADFVLGKVTSTVLLYPVLTNGLHSVMANVLNLSWMG